MPVGGRGNRVAMDRIGGKSFLSITRNLIHINNYIVTIINCFRRYAIAIIFPNQSFCILILAIIIYFITVYGTLLFNLTDKRRSILSSEFLEFWILFLIHKLQTTSASKQDL